MPKRLLVAADLDPGFIARITADARFVVRHQPVRAEGELAAIVGDAEILVTRAYNKVTRRVLDAAPRLELIAQGTSGIDNIDLAYAGERGIAIVHLPGANANAVAELTIGFMIAMTRTVPFYTRELAAGRFFRDDCAQRHELRHYVLGLVGLGEVGRRVARLATGFGMRVQAFDPYLSDDDFRERGATRASLHELMTTSGIVSLHVPLTAETRHLVDTAAVRSMRRGSYLINAARGEVLDQNAALEALAEEHLAGLALDVFDPEPPTAPLPDDPRLILTPHVGGCSAECKTDIGELLYAQIGNWLSAQWP